MKLQRSTPEKQGVKSQAIVDFLTRIKEKNLELHSFMLLKNGQVINECWWKPYTPHYRHQIFSATKSFTSTAIGIAVSEGILTVDTLIADIFKQEIEELDNNIDEKIIKMTVRHLLMMGTGMEYENEGDNAIKAFLSSHIKYEPGSKFSYNSLASHMLSAIITRLTGQKLIDYLKPRLFEPLGIDPVWDEDALGINSGGYGMSIKTEEFAKFGQLYLQKGKWNGKQLIPESWIVEASLKQIENGDNSPGDHSKGYGYQFYMCDPDKVYRADGAFGQECIIMPNENAVIVTTAYVGYVAELFNLMWEILLPALRENNELCENKTAHDKLVKTQKSLSHLTVNIDSPLLPEIRGEYKNDDRSLGHVQNL